MTMNNQRVGPNLNPSQILEACGIGKPMALEPHHEARILGYVIDWGVLDLGITDDHIFNAIIALYPRAEYVVFQTRWYGVGSLSTIHRGLRRVRDETESAASLLARTVTVVESQIAREVASWHIEGASYIGRGSPAIPVLTTPPDFLVWHLVNDLRGRVCHPEWV